METWYLECIHGAIQGGCNKTVWTVEISWKHEMLSKRSLGIQNLEWTSKEINYQRYDSYLGKKLYLTSRNFVLTNRTQRSIIIERWKDQLSLSNYISKYHAKLFHFDFEQTWLYFISLRFYTKRRRIERNFSTIAVITEWKQAFNTWRQSLARLPTSLSTTCFSPFTKTRYPLQPVLYMSLFILFTEFSTLDPKSRDTTPTPHGVDTSSRTRIIGDNFKDRSRSEDPVFRSR